MNEHKDAKTKQHSEMQDRKQKTLERIRSKELPEEKEEREMWTKLIEVSDEEANTLATAKLTLHYSRFFGSLASPLLH